MWSLYGLYQHPVSCLTWAVYLGSYMANWPQEFDGCLLALASLLLFFFLWGCSAVSKQLYGTTAPSGGPESRAFKWYTQRRWDNYFLTFKLKLTFVLFWRRGPTSLDGYTVVTYPISLKPVTQAKYFFGFGQLVSTCTLNCFISLSCPSQKVLKDFNLFQ